MGIESQVRKRDLGIDILKFFAVVFVINSHMDVCYPGKWAMLATGGAIGDALFFFCSGYTLFLGKNDGFVSWYKRRLWRILPALLLCLVLSFLYYGADFWERTGDGFWFVRLILVYYVLLYGLRKFFLNRLWIPCVGIGLLIVGWFLFFYDWHQSVLGYSYFMRAQYFIPMLMGAVIGYSHQHAKSCSVLDVCLLLLSFVGFYGLQMVVHKYAALSGLQLLLIASLNLIVYYLWKVAEAPIVSRIMATSFGSVMLAVGGLCLEVYLSHRPFLTDALNGFFPLNVPLLFVAMLLLAYVVRCVTRFIVQSLQWQGRYDWQAIVKVV